MRIDSRWMVAARRAGLVVLIALLGWAGWTGFKVWRAWDTVDRVGFDTDQAREVLAAGTTTPSTTSPTGSDSDGPVATPTTRPQTLDRDVLNAFLVIGTDERAENGTSVRADVILLIVFPPDTGDALMVSIPRDLYVPSPCYGVKTKINANLNGCGEVSGPELLAIAVEDFTGIAIDHFAVFDFEGFTRIIDTVGGVEICVGEHPVRDTNPGLDGFEMPAGCSIADGDDALGWVRSRRTQILVNGRWVRMPGVTDLTRNERQQELLIAALETLKEVRDINELASLVQQIARMFVVDDGLGLTEAIGIAWDTRSIALEDIHRPVVEVQFSVTPDGESILLPVGSFEDLIRSSYPNADLVYGTAG